jgi:hypothetical protein
VPTKGLLNFSAKLVRKGLDRQRGVWYARIMKRKADEEIPRSLAEAVSSLLGLTTLDFDSFAPRSMAEKLAHQGIL